MPPERRTVIHLVAADLPDGRVPTLLRLLESDPRRQIVVQVGPGPALRRPRPHERLPASLAPSGPFGTRGLSRRLGDLVRGASRDRTVLHAWTATAATYVLTAGQFAREIVQFEPGACVPSRCIMVLPTPRWPDVLRREQWEPERCATIPPVVAGPPDADRRAACRAGFGLSAAQPALLVLPPILRSTGAFIATWAAFLVEQVRPDLRLLVPFGGRERERVVRLVRACRREVMVHLAGPDTPLDDLLAAADLAAFLPAGDAPVESVLAAMAAGVPLVASRVPALTEFLVDGRTARLCPPDGPRLAAQGLLALLESPRLAGEQAAAARQRAAQWLDPAATLRAYAELYDGPAGALRASAAAGAAGLPPAPERLW